MASFLGLLLLLAAVSGAARGQQNEPICVPTGYAAHVVWEEEPAQWFTWTDKAYANLPRTILIETFVERIERLGIFSALVDEASEPHDFDLVARFLWIERRPISSPNDLWIEMSVELRELAYGQTLWSTRTGTSVEVRELAPRIENTPALPHLIARRAAADLATQTALELNRFLKGGGLAQLRGALSSDCPERTVVNLELDDLVFEDRQLVLQSLSDSPCYALRAQESARTDTLPELVIQASTDSTGRTTLLVRAFDEESPLFQAEWTTGAEKARAAALRGLLSRITRFHHRIEDCIHYRRWRDTGEIR